MIVAEILYFSFQSPPGCSLVSGLADRSGGFTVQNAVQFNYLVESSVCNTLSEIPTIFMKIKIITF